MPMLDDEGYIEMGYLANLDGKSRAEAPKVPVLKHQLYLSGWDSAEFFKDQIELSLESGSFGGAS